MSKLYDQAKKATLKEIRDLKVGDVIECYYEEWDEPRLEFVYYTACTSKQGDAHDIETRVLEVLGKRNGPFPSKFPYRSALNTDKFKRVGRLEFVPTGWPSAPPIDYPASCEVCGRADCHCV